MKTIVFHKIEPDYYINGEKRNGTTIWAKVVKVTSETTVAFHLRLPSRPGKPGFTVLGTLNFITGVYTFSEFADLDDSNLTQVRLLRDLKEDGHLAKLMWKLTEAIGKTTSLEVIEEELDIWDAV